MPPAGTSYSLACLGTKTLRNTIRPAGRFEKKTSHSKPAKKPSSAVDPSAPSNSDRLFVRGKVWGLRIYAKEGRTIRSPMARGERGPCRGPVRKITQIGSPLGPQFRSNIRRSRSLAASPILCRTYYAAGSRRGVGQPDTCCQTPDGVAHQPKIATSWVVTTRAPDSSGNKWQWNYDEGGTSDRIRIQSSGRLL